jgi:hypothetical protein
MFGRARYVFSISSLEHSVVEVWATAGFLINNWYSCILSVQTYIILYTLSSVCPLSALLNAVLIPPYHFWLILGLHGNSWTEESRWSWFCSAKAYFRRFLLSPGIIIYPWRKFRSSSIIWVNRLAHMACFLVLLWNLDVVIFFWWVLFSISLSSNFQYNQEIMVPCLQDHLVPL